MKIESPKGNCHFNDTMAWLLIKASRATGHGPSALLERFHRADADSFFDGKVWDHMSAADIVILWEELKENYL